MDPRVHTVIRQIESKASSLLTKAQAQAQQTVLAEEIAVEKLAAEVNLSASRLRALFKAQTKQTIPQYVKEMKLEQARKLLSETYLRISEIALQVGFNDASRFVRDFKKRYGMTPTEYRRQSIQSANNQIGQ